MLRRIVRATSRRFGQLSKSCRPMLLASRTIGRAEMPSVLAHRAAQSQIASVRALSTKSNGVSLEAVDKSLQHDILHLLIRAARMGDLTYFFAGMPPAVDLSEQNDMYQFAYQIVLEAQAGLRAAKAEWPREQLSQSSFLSHVAAASRQNVPPQYADVLETLMEDELATKGESGVQLDAGWVLRVQSSIQSLKLQPEANVLMSSERACRFLVSDESADAMRAFGEEIRQAVLTTEAQMKLRAETAQLQENAYMERADKLMLEKGLPSPHHMEQINVSVWNSDWIDEVCEIASGIQFRTASGLTIPDLIAQCDVFKPDKDTADNVLLAMAALEHVSRLGDVAQASSHSDHGTKKETQALVLAGAEQSSREKVLRRAIIEVIASMQGRNVTQGDACRLLVGPMGSGKTQLLKGLGKICSLLEHANPGIKVVAAFVDAVGSEYPQPFWYMVKALIARQLIDTSNLPSWAQVSVGVGKVARSVTAANSVRRLGDPAAQSQRVQKDRELPQPTLEMFSSWCRSNRVVPVLLIDEVQGFGEQESEDAGKRKFHEVRHQLNIMSQGTSRWPGIVRLTGTWSQTSKLLFQQKKQPLNSQRWGEESIHGLMPDKEALLMCLYAVESQHFKSRPHLRREFAAALAGAMLEASPRHDVGGRLGHGIDRGSPVNLLRETGFVSSVSLSGEEKSGAPFLLTMADVEQWKRDKPHWQQLADAGLEQIRNILRFTAGTTRYMKSAIEDQRYVPQVLSRLRDDLRLDPGFEFFAEWLSKETRKQHAGASILESQHFEECIVAEDPKVLDEAVRRHLAADIVHCYSDRGGFIEHFFRRNIIHVQSKSSRMPGESVVPGLRFAAPLFLQVAAAHTADLMDGLPQAELDAITIVDPLRAEYILEGIAAEAIALNGPSVLLDGCKGTLAYRRLSLQAWTKKRSAYPNLSPEEDRLAELDKLHLMGKETCGFQVPLNTVLKESPDKRKSDLIAVCLPDGGDTAFVIRAQVKMGRKPQAKSKAVQAVDGLLRSWEGQPTDIKTVLEPLRDILARAANLQGKKLVHVPIWLSPIPQDNEDELSQQSIAGVKVKMVTGKDFWDLMIPHVQASGAAANYDHAPELDEVQIRKLLQWERPYHAYEDTLRLRADADKQGDRDVSTD